MVRQWPQVIHANRAEVSISVHIDVRNCVPRDVADSVIQCPFQCLKHKSHLFFDLFIFSGSSSFLHLLAGGPNQPFRRRRCQIRKM